MSAQLARIYLDAWAMKGEPSGVSRYCRALIPRLIAQAPEHEFIILRPSRFTKSEPIADVREVVVPLRRTYVGNVVSAPLLTRVFRRYGRPDLYHSLFQVLPIGLRSGPFGARRIVVTLHDLIWIDHPEEVEPNWLAGQWFRRVAGLSIPYALLSADHVICDSETTSAGAARWIPRDRRSTVHLGVDDVFFDRASSPTPLLPDELQNGTRYIAAFGVPKAYKNLRCLVRAFASLPSEFADVRLVMIGGDGGVQPLIAGENLTGRILITSSPNDVDLRSLVAHARLFVVPSLAEGFGLPALEAMALGTPVAIANIAALNEVAGDAAFQFDPLEPADLGGIIRQALGDKSMHQAMAERGRRRASTFRWQRAADETLSVYNKLL